DPRTPDEPVAALLFRRVGQVLANRDGLDVPVTATVVITRRCVMERMILSPLRERRQRHHAGDPPYDLIRPPRLEEGAVTAVVHDDEGPHEQAGCGQGEHERHDIRQRQRQVHHPEQADQRHEGRYHLPDGTYGRRVLILRDDRSPCWLPGRRDGRAYFHDGVRQRTYRELEGLWRCIAW